MVFASKSSFWWRWWTKSRWKIRSFSWLMDVQLMDCHPQRHWGFKCPSYLVSAKPGVWMEAEKLWFGQYHPIPWYSMGPHRGVIFPTEPWFFFWGCWIWMGTRNRGRAMVHGSCHDGPDGSMVMIWWLFAMTGGSPKWMVYMGKSRWFPRKKLKWMVSKEKADLEMDDDWG